MCGISGFFGVNHLPEFRLSKTLARMSRRGPDSEKFKTFPASGRQVVHLLHSRLSILGLDPRSDEPISRNECHLVFNGEI